MRHEMLTQRAPFCISAMAKKGTLSQHFVTHVVPPQSGKNGDQNCSGYEEERINKQQGKWRRELQGCCEGAAAD